MRAAEREFSERGYAATATRSIAELDASRSKLMQADEDDHRNPVNRACHTVGIPLIAASIPVAATVVGLPAAAGMFAVGWTFQLVGFTGATARGGRAGTGSVRSST